MYNHSDAFEGCSISTAIKKPQTKNPKQVLQKPAMVKSGSNVDISNVKNSFLDLNFKIYEPVQGNLVFCFYIICSSLIVF